MKRAFVVLGMALGFAVAAVAWDDAKPAGKTSAVVKADASKAADSQKQEAAIRELGIAKN